MSKKRGVITLFDRPGGRWLLSLVASRYARRITGSPIEVYFDGVWIRKFGDRALVDDRRFDYYKDTFAGTVSEWEAYGKETDSYYFWQYRPQRGDVIVDVGAGIGTDTVTFSNAVGPEGRVLAIEAHPLTYKRLLKTCQLHNLRNVIPIHASVMDQEGTVFIEDTSHHLTSRVSNGRVGHPVPGTTLDSICEASGLGDISFLKMNIEGAERLAVRGAEKVIERTKYVCIACHDFLARAPDDEWYRTKGLIVEWLREKGFDVRSRDEHPRPYVRDHVHGVRSR